MSQMTELPMFSVVYSDNFSDKILALAHFPETLQRLKCLFNFVQVSHVINRLMKILIRHVTAALVAALVALTFTFHKVATLLQTKFAWRLSVNEFRKKMVNIW